MQLVPRLLGRSNNGNTVLANALLQHEEFATKFKNLLVVLIELLSLYREDADVGFAGVGLSCNGEPPRDLRRLISLRGLSHEQEVEPVFT